ncbi:TrmH family RNA methyltransferase [Phytoactinopolyspora mesophila]|uniref:RNA methyltransferase n=1 Tax=Phytoactinopolyspora mesophila TaxID=2650750 RepID=A0A7K3M229_9ACTN|nr:RNA methyltransferase [Phytoactinopolyspora mesophila]
MLTQRSERVRQARKLTRRAGREKTGQFLAEGAQAVREAVRAGSDRVIEVFVTPAAKARHADIVDTAESAGVGVHLADDDALAGLSETVTPQGIVAVCRSLAASVDDVPWLGPPGAPGGRPSSPGLLVAVLVEAQDPGNAGTVIRCADAAGAAAVVLTSGSVDPQSGKAVRASAGSLFHLPVVTGATAAVVIDRLRDGGYTVLAADGTGVQDLDDAEAAGLLSRPTAWLFGNEARGLSDDVLELADHVVRVPIYGQAESLNLATAAAVCLYASARAQR